MKTKRYFTALGAFFVLALGIAACGSSVPGNSVANVGGNPVTAQAFNHWMFVAAKSQAAQSPGQPVIVPTDPPQFAQCIANVRKQIPSLAKTAAKTLKSDCQNLFTSLSSQVMDFLIKAYWYQAEAHKDNLTVKDSEVLSAFNVAKKQQFTTPAQYTSFLTQTGQTQDDILFRFRINEIFKKLLAKQGSTVTAAVIQSYYNSHISQFSTPETRDLEIVLTKTAAQANAAKQALSKGQSWAAVAKKYSTDAATKNNGGRLLGVAKGQQDAALDAAAFSAAANKLTGPVKGQFGYYLVQVTKIHAASRQTLAQATAVIRQTLTSQQQTKAQSAVDAVAKTHWLGQTSCRSGYAMADCSGYKAPKTSTSTTSTASTG
jgi:foldase protein PrsA